MQKIYLLSFLIPLLYSSISSANDLSCKVVSVIDGNTIKCLIYENELKTIRLYQIEAPKRKQNFGIQSRKLLSDLVLNKTIFVEIKEKDKIILGIIYIDSPIPCPYKIPNDMCAECSIRTNINLEMIQLGMAWYYPFTKQNSKYQDEQEKAKANKIGLWINKNAVAPWDYSKNKK